MVEKGINRKYMEGEIDRRSTSYKRQKQMTKKE